MQGGHVAERRGRKRFTGDAGQGGSNIRRWLIENDWLEAIVALPLNLFYNTGIATYIWVLSNKKPVHRESRVQLIDASQWFKPLRKNLGKKNCELSPGDIERITRTFLDFKETSESKIFPNIAFGYWKVTLEQRIKCFLDRAFTIELGQVQNAHVFAAGALAPAAQERVVRPAEGQAREQFLAPAIAVKGAGLAHQREDDVMIINAGIAPSAQSRQ